MSDYGRVKVRGMTINPSPKLNWTEMVKLIVVGIIIVIATFFAST